MIMIIVFYKLVHKFFECHSTELLLLTVLNILHNSFIKYVDPLFRVFFKKHTETKKNHLRKVHTCFFDLELLVNLKNWYHQKKYEMIFWWKTYDSDYDFAF